MNESLESHPELSKLTDGRFITKRDLYNVEIVTYYASAGNEPHDTKLLEESPIVSLVDYHRARKTLRTLYSIVSSAIEDYERALSNDDNLANTSKEDVEAIREERDILVEVYDALEAQLEYFPG